MLSEFGFRILVKTQYLHRTSQRYTCYIIFLTGNNDQILLNLLNYSFKGILTSDMWNVVNALTRVTPHIVAQYNIFLPFLASVNRLAQGFRKWLFYKRSFRTFIYKDCKLSIHTLDKKRGFHYKHAHFKKFNEAIVSYD